MEWINFEIDQPIDGQEVYYKFPGMGEKILLIGTFHKVGEGYLIMSEVGIIPISCMKPSFWKSIPNQPERSK
jgi:hypothetical protein